MQIAILQKVALTCAAVVIALLLSSTPLLSQENMTQLNGRVTDSTGNPITGASVLNTNTKQGTTTGESGDFSIKINKGQILQISYTGYGTKNFTYVGQEHPVITLVATSTDLNDVVVIGYQTVSRKDLTGSVASISGKEISSVPVANAAQALQGKLPGVNVVSQDGRPDASVAIRIRGGSSISQSSDPLILVDGVPTGSLSDIPSDQIESIDVLKDASSTAIYGARGANGVIVVTTKGAKVGQVTTNYNGYVKINTPAKYLETLNPYDYLKYVWANAAANGEAYQTPFEQLYGIGAYTENNPAGIESYRNTPTYNIQKQVYKRSTSQNHSFSVSGGTDKTKVLLSGNFVDEQGMKLNSFYKRANVSFRATQKIFQNLDLSVNARYTDTRNLGDEGTTNGSGSLLSSSYRFRPIDTTDILGDLTALRTGNMEQYGKNSSWDTYSSLSRIQDYYPLSTSQSVRSLFSLNWKITNGLTYHSDFNIGKAWDQAKIWAGAVYNNYLDDATGEKLYAGSVDYQKADSWNLRWANTLNYNMTFSTVNKLNVLLGQEVSNSGGSNIRIMANHFPSNFTKENAFALINQYDQEAGTSSFSSTINTPGRILSFFGRANYSLLDRYLLTVTFRADGSSRFAPEQRWGYFPAAAFAWRLSEERFLKNVGWLDNLKLRLSYGEVGNDGISSDLWSQPWTSESDRRWQYVIDNKYQSAYDLASEQMANASLKWETSVTRNIGIDFELFGHRLNGTIDLYKNTTKNLLMLTGIPGITGFATTYANIGQFSNKGLEISLSGTVFQNSDWNVTLGGNINFNKANVDRLADNVTGLYGTGWASTSTYPAADYILKVGSPVGLVRGLVYDGFYTTDDFNYANGVYTLKEGIPDQGSFIGVVHGIGTNERPADQLAYPGLIKYKDLDGNGVIDDHDLTVIGETTPVHTGGFNLSATYKSFDFGAYFNWSYGNDIYNANKLGGLYGYKESGVYENKLAILKDAYKIYDVVDGQLIRLNTPEQLEAANKNATLPLAYNENGVTSSLGIEDGSYLRLNTITLGYSLPKSLLKKAGINNLRIYGSVYNVLTITGYSGLDPEVNANTAQGHAVYPTTGLDWGTYPRARSFVLGLNLNF